MFTAKDYKEAHERLDAIFANGVVDYETCFKDCKGQCCSGKDAAGNLDPSLPWHITAMVWNEHLYYEDPENEIDGFNFICKRKDKINCANKPLICKMHPFYPKRIALRLEDCDFSISVSVNRKFCSSIALSAETMKKLEEFYRWLYTPLDNRIAYINTEVVQTYKDTEYAELVYSILDRYSQGEVVGESYTSKQI